MAKYGRFDPRNKKRSKDKYRSDKKTVKSTDSYTRADSRKLKEIEKKYSM